MDFESFDNDAGASDEEYFAFVAWLSARTSEEFRGARGDAVRQKTALLRFYQTGLRANLTVGELIDFIAVSSPSIPERAGYTDDEGDAVIAVSDRLTDEEVRQA